ncbi:MAG: glycosyltransferase [Synergistaceae bacterium]|nr:glycosyltransferase [Synergistaceae bacterium]
MKKTKLAPIALFVYSRPDHLKRTVEALAANTLAAESELIIFSDGPKNDDVISRVEQVRLFIDKIKGFASIRTIKREKNMGLANSIITGVTQVINEYGKIIVLEDDLVTSKFFLDYMNDGLDLYENNREVSSINGFMHPLKVSSTPIPESYFLPHSDCLGWGTWKRVWDNFNSDACVLLKELKKRKLVDKFDFDSSYPYTRLLKQQIKGKVDSWAIRWYATNFLLDLKGLYPGKSLVQHIGFDSYGTHCGEFNNSDELFNSSLAESYNKIQKVAVKIDPVLYGYLRDYYKRIFSRRNAVIEFIFDIVRTILPKPILRFTRKIRVKRHHRS